MLSQLSQVPKEELWWEQRPSPATEETTEARSAPSSNRENQQLQSETHCANFKSFLLQKCRGRGQSTVCLLQLVVNGFILVLIPGKLFRSADLYLDIHSYAFASCTAGLIKSLISAPKFGTFRVQVLNVANIQFMHTVITDWFSVTGIPNPSLSLFGFIW